MIGFHWIIQDLLAGASKPGLYNEMEDDLNFIQERGFDVVLTLTEEPLLLPSSAKLKVIHFPIPDMGIPQPRTAYQICSEIHEMMGEGKKVLIHCKAGLGRTGTILASLLVMRGSTAPEAIKKVRMINNSYLQNGLQENFIKHFHTFRIKAVENSEV